jgi:glycosyltransferase involved in cell wall biosynthesis
MNRPPLLPDVGVLALVPDYWSTCWQSRHHVLTRLARFFHVVWINPAHYWREALFARDSAPMPAGDNGSFPGFILYADSWLPRVHHPDWLAQATFQLRLKRARRLLVRQGCKKIILYIWRPEFAPALNLVPFDLSCYHIDDEYSFSDIEVELNPAEKALITKVDQVFIHSLGLMEKKGAINSHTTLIPNGVDFSAYASPAREPEDLTAIPRPRIGYTGYIKKHLDWGLILELTKRHSEWSFVFVGPYSPHAQIERPIRELAARHNVHFLGSKSFDRLVAYPQHFNVCIMPFQLDAYTNNIYPLKLHEYLASGTPVVSSPIRTLRDFSNVVLLANGVDEWSKTLTHALEPAAACPEAVAARRKIAREYDWEKLTYLLARVLCERLGSEHGTQFHKLNNSDNRVVLD